MKIHVLTESRGAGEALARAFADDPEVEFGSIATDPGGMLPNLEPRDVVIASRGLSSSVLMRLLGQTWRMPQSPRVVFVEFTFPTGPVPGALEVDASDRLTLRSLLFTGDEHGPMDRIPFRLHPAGRKPTPEEVAEFEALLAG